MSNEANDKEQDAAEAFTVEHVETITRTVFRVRKGREVKRVNIDGRIEIYDAQAFAEAFEGLEGVRAQLEKSGPPAEAPGPKMPRTK